MSRIDDHTPTTELETTPRRWAMLDGASPRSDGWPHTGSFPHFGTPPHLGGASAFPHRGSSPRGGGSR